MKKGDVISIYYDPITQQDEEGKARLIKKKLDLGNGMEYWTVKFIGNGDIPSQSYRKVKA